MQPQCIVKANDSRHDDIVSRVESAIEELKTTGKRISFYAIANKAQVSRSTLYRCDDLRRLVKEARDSAAMHQLKPANQDDRTAELEHALARVTKERDELAQAARHTPSVSYALTRISEAA